MCCGEELGGNWLVAPINVKVAPLRSKVTPIRTKVAPIERIVAPIIKFSTRKKATPVKLEGSPS